MEVRVVRGTAMAGAQEEGVERAEDESADGQGIAAVAGSEVGSFAGAEVGAGAEGDADAVVEAVRKAADLREDWRRAATMSVVDLRNLGELPDEVDGLD